MNQGIFVAAALGLALAGCFRQSDTTSSGGGQLDAPRVSTGQTAGFEKRDVGAILADLKHADWTIRRDAANAFPFRAPLEYRSAIPDLILALPSEHDSLVLASATALSHLADRKGGDGTRLPELADAIQPLSEIIRSSAAEETRRWATIAVVDIAQNLGPETIDQVVPLLTDAATDSSYDVSLFAMDGLGEFGSRARSSIPAIITQLGADDHRAAATHTLRRSVANPIDVSPPWCKTYRCVRTSSSRNRSPTPWPVSVQAPRTQFLS